MPIINTLLQALLVCIALFLIYIMVSASITHYFEEKTKHVKTIYSLHLSEVHPPKSYPKDE